jgi:hypothetical protein
MVGYGMARDELIDEARAKVAAGGAAVECESAGVGRGGLGDLSGAEEDVAGESLDFSGGGRGGESTFGCGECLGKFVGCELGADEAGICGG